MDVFLKKAEFFLSLGDMDSTIAIALQTLCSIGENYEDELLYADEDDDFGTSLYCEHAGGLLMKVVGQEQLIAMYTSSLNDYAEQNMGRRNYD